MNEDYENYNFWAEQTAAREQEQDGNAQESSVYRMSKSEIPGNYPGDNQETNYNNNTVWEPGQEEPGKPGGRQGKLARLIGSALLFGLIAGITFAGVNWAVGSWNKGTQTEASGGQEGNSALDASVSKDTIGTTRVASGVVESTDVSKVVENTMPAIVSITSTVSQTYNFFGQDYSEEGQGSGSGIIVGKNDKELLIATNNHVVEDAKTINVTFIDNEVLSAEIKGTDKTADLAVVAVQTADIKKETLEAIKVAELGDSDGVKVGQMAIAIGNALGYGQSVTVGYISAKDREVNVSDTTMVLLQTDAAINPGNSGGALLNINGEVIGINSVKYASGDVEGMGYAIPITRATPIINELMSREKLTEEEKGYLGITGTDVTQEDNTRYNMPVGVYVYELSKDGAASEAGIVTGDIITKINGTVVDTIAALQERVNSYRVGTKIELTVMRNTDGTYQEKVITVTLKGSQTLDSLKERATEDPTQGSGGILPENPDGSNDSSGIQDPSFWE